MTTMANLGWPASVTIIVTLVTVLGFGATVVKLYLDQKNKNNNDSGLQEDIQDIKNRVNSLEASVDATSTETVKQHSEEIVQIRHSIEKLKTELDHIKESFKDKDIQILSQIEEMKKTLDKLTDMLIRIISAD